MTTSIQPGWYDDPEDSNGQRYWDGRDWTPHRHPKPISGATPPSGLPAQPPPPPPPPYQQAPGPPPRGAPPKKSRTPIIIAAVVGVVAVLALIGWLASPGTPGTSSPSASYQAGYWYAYHNEDRKLGMALVFVGVHQACANSATTEAPVQGLNTQEWTQGCEDALKKMGHTEPPPTPTVECSNGVCTRP